MMDLPPINVSCPRCGLVLGLLAAEALSDTPDPPPSSRQPRVSFREGERGEVVAVRRDPAKPE